MTAGHPRQRGTRIGPLSCHRICRRHCRKPACPSGACGYRSDPFGVPVRLVLYAVAHELQRSSATAGDPGLWGALSGLGDRRSR